MGKPRVYKRPHVADKDLNKILQQIDDEFSNVYQAIATFSGPTGATGATGPPSTVAGATGPTGPSA